MSTTVPRKMHFVWFGNPVPPKYLANIASFWARNRGYEVNIWTDNPGLIHHSIATAGARGSSQDSRFARDLEWPRDFARIRNISEIGIPPLRMAWVDQERHGAYKNLAAASDIVRLQILYSEGGIYLDTDVRPRGSALERYKSATAPAPANGFGFLYAPYGALFWRSSQATIINNCAIAAVPQSELIWRIISESDNMHLGDSPEFVNQWHQIPAPRVPAKLHALGPTTMSGVDRVRFADKRSNPDQRKLWTLHMSGPEVILRVLESCELYRRGGQVDPAVLLSPFLIDEVCDHTWFERGARKRRDSSLF